MAIEIWLGEFSSEKKKRDFKGKSLIQFPDTFCVIDIETTGLDPRYDEIIEIAAIKVENGVVTDNKSSLIKPENPVSEYITQLTGITNEMLDNAPSIDTVLKEFLDLWQDSILLGHNVNFDINFLYDACTKLYSEPLKNNFIDTLRLARRLVSETKNHKLKTLTKHFKIDTPVEHRSWDDAHNTLLIFNKLKEICLQKYDSVDEFTKYCSRQANGKTYYASQITSNKSEFDESHPLFNQSVVFTGTLEKMVRKDAMQLVVDFGGRCSDSVNKSTNYLVMGNQDYAVIKDGKSSKHKKAEKLKLEGQDIEIISENVFYDMLNS